MTHTINNALLPRATKLFFACAALLLTLLLPGCFGGNSDSPSRPKVIPASGVVTYQGQPVEGADVTFVNSTAGTTGTAKTDAAGKFVLTTFAKHDGVTPGSQLVAIRRVDVINKTPKDVDVSAGGVGIPPEIKWLVPEKFSNTATSELTAEVAESGTNVFQFDLK